MKIFIITISVFVAMATAYVCLPNECQLVDCVPATPCNGRFVKGGGYCGCCDSCLTQLAENESCMSQLLLGVPSTAECEMGTHCDAKTLKCVRDAAPAASTPCQSELNQYYATQGGSQPLLGARQPVCDSNGFYAPKQCSGSQCYCVTRDGKQIQGYSANIWEATGQTCQCARDQAEYMATGLIGKLFFCTNDGSYQKYKCVGSVCFCADTDGNQVGTSSVPIGSVDKLKC